ncbi:ankyrin repeat, SAM and basic leucine zipper domain-containing protein 1 [Boleophthalmus pectinirostris]|uniref:ankyrin repeat, SAM and basic leucine zipper domain-containing protein 1 n=1 Tax=Boleophthalmus pectinirostris TaxID=150288 RepID=UPI00242CCDAC|nr:ankyrin repeat, SAM and basic leucine zipper domain-containing protein 1 [Boleophthalmus pectinirostris]
MVSLEFAFPAGEESDFSSDEWDIGFPDKKPSTKKKEADSEAASAEDNKVSLLKKAISKGDVETVEQLLDNGLDVDSILDYGWTPLMCAVSGGNPELTKMLLDRGASANFSKDNWTVLMACCTASVPEEKVCSCLELLLSRNVDPNIVDRSHMSCLMLASRSSYSKVINLLVSHGASVNAQDLNGYTALCYAVQYGREESVLKLLQLGADKNLKTKLGKTATDLALQLKHTQIARILTSTSNQNPCAYPFFSEESQDCASKLDELELLFHGLGLGYLTDIITDQDISWSQLLTMDKTDLHKIGITEPEDQQKVLTAVQQLELDRVDLETVSELGAANMGSEELHTFLISMRQQCCYLTETIQDVVNRFPCRASQLVFSLDPQGKALSVCNQLLIQTKDLHQEVTLLRNLLCQMDQADDCSEVPVISSKLSWRRVLKGAALSMLGAGALLLLAKGPGVRTHLGQWSRW